MTSLLIILSLIVGLILGSLFGGLILKHLFTALGKPYFRTVISRGKEQGTTNVDAQFNSLFIYEIERIYRVEGGDLMTPTAPDNEKVAIYLYDTISNIAEPYIPPPTNALEELDDSVPPMGFRGGEEVKQVVDLGKQQNKNDVDFVS